jgi:hypothetical protein
MIFITLRGNALLFISQIRRLLQPELRISVFFEPEYDFFHVINSAIFVTFTGYNKCHHITALIRIL